jgi:hypothetical protein
MDFTRVDKLINKFEHLGKETTLAGVVLIGKAPSQGKHAWINKIYPSLNQSDIIEMEKTIGDSIPSEYEHFLMNYSNGLNVLLSTLSLYGLRKQRGRSIEASQQPYSLITPNKSERPDNAKVNYFFIGGYNWDGSLLYIDKNTGVVHCCQRYDATSQKSWPTFEDMIVSEIERLYNFFDDDGTELDEDKPTIPC